VHDCVPPPQETLHAPQTAPLLQYGTGVGVGTQPVPQALLKWQFESIKQPEFPHLALHIVHPLHEESGEHVNGLPVVPLTQLKAFTLLGNKSKNPKPIKRRKSKFKIFFIIVFVSLKKSKILQKLNRLL